MKRKAEGPDEDGPKRKWLRSYETAPAQWLNVYGRSSYAAMPNKDVFARACEPLKFCEWGTELGSGGRERRGVGLNRGIHALKEFVDYNEEECVKKVNKVLLKNEVCTEFYKELGVLSPSLKYCLARRDYTQASGAVGRRCVADSHGSSLEETRTPEGLRRHSATVYAFLDVHSKSALRTIMKWQAAGGLSYVADVHRRLMEGFRAHGNEPHATVSHTEVSLDEFLEAVVSRHSQRGDPDAGSGGYVTNEFWG